MFLDYCSKTPLDLTLRSDKLAKLSFVKYCSVVPITAFPFLKK